MIQKMKKYTFLVFHKEYEAFLEQLREVGVVHISEDENSIQNDPEIQQYIARKSEICRLLEQKSSNALIAEKTKVTKQVDDLQKKITEVNIWGDFSSADVARLSDAGYTLRYFICPRKKFQEEWGVVIAEKSGNVYFATVNGAVFDAVEFDPNLVKEVSVPASRTELNAELDELNKQLEDINSRTENWVATEMPKLEQELATLEQNLDWQRVKISSEPTAYGAVRVAIGYCPVENCAQLDEMLEAQHICYQAVDPVPGDDAPAKMVNGRFASLFESLTGMYGWPTYGEFDPTPLLAPFFLLFFAMCMGDGGYGIVLMIFGWLLAKGKIQVDMFKGMGPIITVLGAGTFVVGLLLGTFFGMPLYEQSWVPEAVKPFIIQGKFLNFDIQMLLAIGIGVFHICFAMIVKCLCYTMRFGWKETISSWSWTLLIVGSVITMSVAMLLSLDTQIVTYIMIGIGAVSALGIYIFNTPGRNPLINIGMGLLDTYNMASGLLGDVLSYLRLYALGLAGGALGKTFNDLACSVLGDGPSWAWTVAIPGFILIILLGHVLNILMSCLGAFVHPLRLTFVEYFKNSGYEGKGILYKPFKK